MSSGRKRILFMAEGITMTHFVRPAALANTLDRKDYDVYFWTPKRYHRLLQQSARSESLPHKSGELWTLDPAAFLQSLAHGKPLYTAEVLRHYVEDDLRIFREVQPDLVIGDFRLSLSISAPVAGIPFASVFNAHWSPYRRQPAVVPELPLTRYVPPRLLNLVFAAIRPAVFALHAKPVNDVRWEYGLPPLPYGLRGVYTAGDIVLYPDIPEFVPVNGAPANHHFIGVCPWQSNSAKPAWWDEVMRSPLPKVFVSLGSSGPVKALPAVLEAAGRLPLKIIVSTSGRDVGTLGANVYACDLLPYEETARHSALVVSHGGTGGLYPALSAGAPMLAIPGNIDNHLSAALLEKSGAGLSVRVEHATPRALYSAMERILLDSSFKAAARRWAVRIARHDTRQIFPELLNRWFGLAPRVAVAPVDAAADPVLKALMAACEALEEEEAHVHN